MTGLIFAIVPFTRALRNLISDTFGREVFTYATAILIGVFLLLALRWCLKSMRRNAIGAVVLLAVAALYGYLIFALKSGSPEEAVHYILYGALGIVLYRAYLHHVRDYGIYILAILTGTAVGVIDEALQWLAPDRIFDTRDIWLNLTGVLLVQIAIAFGLRPTLISGAPVGTTLRNICYTCAALAGLLGLCHLNTPSAVWSYAKSVHWLNFLTQEDDPMIEYGYLHEDEEFGAFKSRLSATELARTDAERGSQAAAILDRYQKWEGFRAFVKEYPGHIDPYLHEARVHLRSRNITLGRARKSETAQEAKIWYTYAFREHQILERHFGHLYGASSDNWSAEEAKDVKAQIDPGLTRLSKVSQHLVTRYSKFQAMVVLGVTIPLFLILGYLAGRGRKHI